MQSIIYIYKQVNLVNMKIYCVYTHLASFGYLYYMALLLLV